MKNSRNISAGIVIIGGGGAGLAAALEAAERGAKNIIVVEERGNLGGNTNLAHGLFAAGSLVQQRQRIVAGSDQMFRKAMNWAHWNRINPRILRAFINMSAGTINWLESKGLEFDLIRFYPDQVPLVQHNIKGKGACLVKTLTQECREAGVEFLVNTACRRILRDNAGKVTGIIAAGEKEEITISAPGVIITTGGFAGNKELLAKYCPECVDDVMLSGLPLHGDGLALAEAAGAAIEDYATMVKEGPRLDAHAWPLAFLERDPAALWVNREGRRFIDETVGYHVFVAVNAMLRQPGKVSYALFDAPVKKMFADRLPGMDAGMQDEIKKDRVKVTASLAEMAAWIGADEKTLQATVESYNQYCRQGYDEDFDKERKYLLPLATPPYYAIKGMVTLLDTIGGIRINEKMEVLDVNNNAIPGLYAAGSCTGGWESELYCSELTASACGFAVNSGRIAGANAQKYAAAD